MPWPSCSLYTVQADVSGLTWQTDLSGRPFQTDLAKQSCVNWYVPDVLSFPTLPPCLSCAAVKLSHPSCPIPAVFFLVVLFCSSYPLSSVRLYFPDCPFRLSCPGFLSRLFYPFFPVPAVLNQLTCPSYSLLFPAHLSPLPYPLPAVLYTVCPVPTVLSQPSYTPSVLYQLSSPSRPIHCLSCTNCPLPAVLYTVCPVPTVLSQPSYTPSILYQLSSPSRPIHRLSCTNCPLPAVLYQLSSPSRLIHRLSCTVPTVLSQSFYTPSVLYCTNCPLPAVLYTVCPVPTVLDYGRPSISGSIQSIKCKARFNVQCKRDWCVAEM
jgi:hypothetical protein